MAKLRDSLIGFAIWLPLWLWISVTYLGWQGNIFGSAAACTVGWIIAESLMWMWRRHRG